MGCVKVISSENPCSAKPLVGGVGIERHCNGRKGGIASKCSSEHARQTLQSGIWVPLCSKKPLVEYAVL